MLSDPTIDAVYISSPNGLHRTHTLKALRAGKHVLCEKPLASNEEEAKEMAREAAAAGKVLFEAFHYRYHPAILRAKQIATEELGQVKRVAANFPIPSVYHNRDDIRFNYELAGGSLVRKCCFYGYFSRHIDYFSCNFVNFGQFWSFSVHFHEQFVHFHSFPFIFSSFFSYFFSLSLSQMDAGSYCVNFVRYFMDAEPVEVSAASAKTHPSTPNTDDTAFAKLRFEDSSRTATVECSLVGSLLNPFPFATVYCERGEIEVYNFVLPQIYHKLIVRPTGQPQRVEQLYEGGKSTFLFQLAAFVEAVRNGKEFPTTAEDAVKNMRVIDMIYAKTNLPLRQGK